jgi:hypothetical protein
MARARIPKQHQNGLAKVLAMPEDVFQRLINALKRSPFSLSFRDNLTRAVASVDEISPKDAKSIAEALRSIYIARANTGLSEGKFVDEVVKAINESSSDELLKIADSSETNKERLILIFGIEPLLLVAKAGTVMVDHDKTFHDVRVLTDIRPVFDETPNSTKAMMIVHNLKIHYHQGEQHRDLYVALDAQDVQKFIDTLERAKKKAEILKSILTSTNVPYIEPEY